MQHLAGGRRCALVLLAGFVLALLSSPTMAQELTLRVPQGEVGRWSGEGTERCGMDGRSWKALEGACYYPVDFQRSPGHVEIARWRNGGSIETAWLVIEERERELQSIDFPDDRYVNPPPEDLEEHYRQQARIKPVFRRRSGEALFTIPLGKPADPLPEGRYFGVPREFNGEPKNAHTGTDYAIGMGNAVLAVADGKVAIVGDHFFAGTSVYLYHGDGLVSMYFHLSEALVEEGQEVKKGDQIAKIGSTGRSTGPHLHLGLRWRGARIDPEAVVDPERTIALDGE